MTLAKGTLAKGVIAGIVTPPLDGLAVEVLEPIGSVSSTRPTVSWTHTPLTSVQTQWQITISDAGGLVYQTPWAVSTATSHQIADPMSAGAVYLVRVSIITDFPSSGFSQSTFTVETPDLGDEMGMPFLRQNMELIMPKRVRR